jgi:DNA-binding transcriptional LysR family regulator
LFSLPECKRLPVTQEVAHHEHRLHRIKGMVRVSDLNNHLLAVIEEASHAEPRQGRPVLGETWHVNSIETAIEAVRSGVCFGWLPKDRIHAELESGTLRILRLAAGTERRIPLFLLFPDESRPALLQST